MFGKPAGASRDPIALFGALVMVNLMMQGR